MKNAHRKSLVTTDKRLLSGVLLAAFFAPGAWMLTTLPPQSIAQFLQLLTAAAIVTVCALGLFRGEAPPNRIVFAVGGVLAVVVLSLVFADFPVQQALYDLYGEMPGLMWLAYPAVFLAVAHVAFGRSVRDALKLVVFAAAGLVAVMAVWRWVNGFVMTFGSPAYSVPALSVVIALSLGLARTSREHRGRYYALAVAIAAGLVYAGGGLSAVFMVLMTVVLSAVIAPGLLGVSEKLQRGVRIVGIAALVVVSIGMALVQFPSLGAGVLPIEELRSGEQTVATRLHLWGAAEEMFADSSILGYGPAGYRFSAVEYYDSGVFPYVVGAGFDPTAYSAPSPHSLLWEALTRIGAVGLSALIVLLVVWLREARDKVASSAPGPRWLRLSLVVGFLTYAFSLMVTPVHFASGLLGAAVAGLAIAGEGRSAGDDRDAKRTPVLVVGLAVAVAFAGYGAWRMVGLSSAEITGTSLDIDSSRVEAARALIPGEPLNERRSLELALWLAADDAALAAARQRIDAAPGYVLGYAPNLPAFALISMAKLEEFGVVDGSSTADLTWERSLLDRAVTLAPGVPSVVAEQLHLAVLSGDVDALPDLVRQAREQAASYPYTEDYIARAQALLSGRSASE